MPGEKNEPNAADFSHENFVRGFTPWTVDLHPAPVLEPVDFIKTRTADDAQSPIRQAFVSFLPRADCPSRMSGICGSPNRLCKKMHSEENERGTCN